MKSIKEIENDIKSLYAERDGIENDIDIKPAALKRQIRKIVERVKLLKKCIVAIKSVPNISDSYCRDYIDKCNLKISKLQSEKIESHNSVEVRQFKSKIKKECNRQREYINSLRYISGS